MSFLRPRPCTAIAPLLAIALVAATGCTRDEPGPAPAADPTSTPVTSAYAAAPRTGESRAVEPGTSQPPATPVRLIASATWADSDFGVTLEVAPTPAGRQAWGADDSALAWAEVLELAPDAGTPGMWEQFDCHWMWARILEPAKPTWNVEPWRPVVSPERMLAEGCNPGGPEV